MSQNKYPVSDRNRVRQASKRAVYDHQAVHMILDQTLVGHVAFVSQDKPFVIPMLFARHQDELLFHGSTKSRLMRMLISGQSICVSVTILDGLVLAKSLFHHSMNYRAVTVFGTGRELIDETERETALRIISDKTMPGRWEDARLPSPQEMKATLIAAVKIDSASAKVRTGGPVEDPDDLKLPIWSGVVPLHQMAAPTIAAPNEATPQKIPDYVERWREQHNSYAP